MSAPPGIPTGDGGRIGSLLAPLLLSLLGGSLLVGGTLWLRPAIPVDETRYLAVAWEMWTRGDFLVPYLNGEPYSHKPPLLFWMMHLGWWLLGVNDLWPRLVAPLAGLASLGLTVRLGAALWPDQGTRLALAAPLLLGGGFWAAFGTAIMFDLWLVAFTLGGLLGLVRVWRGRSGWPLLATMLAGGALIKGPVIFLILAWPVLLAPWWMGVALLGGWWRWYGAAFLAALAGGLVALAWAIPAAWQGGEAYAHDIFLGQTAGRALDSFSHRRPFWWYLPWLPLVWLPWTLWRPAWEGLRALRLDPGTRLCLTWTLPPLLLLSLVSGKQVQYLLPLFPALALLVARGLSGEPTPTLARPWGPAALFGVLGVLLAAAPVLRPLADALPGIQDASPWPGLGVLAAGLGLGLWGRGTSQGQAWGIAATTLVSLLALHLALRPILAAYDVRPLATHLAQVQGRDIPVAHVGKYRGQYHFAGRLTRPLEVLSVAELVPWLGTHPEHRVVIYTQVDGAAANPGLSPAAEFLQDFRARQVSLWRAADLLQRPDVLADLR